MLLTSFLQLSAADTTAVKERFMQGVFVDVDIVEPLISVLDGKHKGANASVSFNLKNSIFPSFLVGCASYDASGDYASYIKQPDDYTYKVKGPYFKAGVDFNLLKSKKKYKPECYLGVRYAFSSYDYEVKNVFVRQAGWSDYNTINVSDKVFAHWGEFLGGVRVPVYNRLYLGFEGDYKWSFKPKKETFNNADGSKTVIRQSYAPGFGDKNGVNWGFRYMVSFFL